MAKVYEVATTTKAQTTNKRMVEYSEYARAEQAANKHRMDALRMKEEADRQRSRANLLGTTYETIARTEIAKREQAQIRQLREDLFVQQLCYNAELAMLKQTYITAQKKRIPLIAK
jgi:hypothetical protein